MKYSIIMPVYNAEKTLRRSIDSVIKQTVGDWELICVDDGSKDNSYSVLKSLSNLDNRIKVIHKNNGGPGSARNKGISLAKGEYIAFLDADDMWTFTFLETIEKKIANKPKDIIFYNFYYADGNGHPKKEVKLSDYRSCKKKKLLLLQMCGVFEWGMVKVIRRELIQKYNLLFGENSVGEEAVFSFDVFRLSKSYSFVTKPIYYYLDNENGQHKKGDEDPWNSVVSQMKNHIDNIGAFDDYVEGIRLLAMRSCMIACYRISQNSSCKMAAEKIKEKIRDYDSKYDIKQVNTEIWGRTNRILSFLIKNEFSYSLWFLSKLRNKI